jgi:hypothetical protein
MEVFTLIARKKNVALVFVSYLLVALAAISLLTICIGFAPGILFAVVFGLIAYLMIMAQNTEFEYSYFDGELRFAKIKNKSRRKRLGIYSMESVAAIAPAGDRSVYNYENGTLKFTNKGEFYPNGNDTYKKADKYCFVEYATIRIANKNTYVVDKDIIVDAEFYPENMHDMTWYLDYNMPAELGAATEFDIMEDNDIYANAIILDLSKILNK